MPEWFPRLSLVNIRDFSIIFSEAAEIVRLLKKNNVLLGIIFGGQERSNRSRTSVEYCPYVTNHQS